MGRFHGSRQTITYATRGEFADVEGDKILSKKAIGKISRRLGMNFTYIYRHSFLTFYLFCDDINTGIEKIMTGYEAIMRNTVFEDNFYNSLDENGVTTKKLLKWQLSKNDVDAIRNEARKAIY